MKRALLASIVAGIAFTFALPVNSAQAQPTEDKKVKTYDFTGDEIDGDLVKPDGEFVDTRKFANHTSLIRIRKDFIKEILKSAEDL
jgi:hypothetical protein